MLGNPVSQRLHRSCGRVATQVNWSPGAAGLALATVNRDKSGSTFIWLLAALGARIALNHGSSLVFTVRQKRKSHADELIVGDHRNVGPTRTTPPWACATYLLGLRHAPGCRAGISDSPLRR